MVQPGGDWDECALPPEYVRYMLKESFRYEVYQYCHWTQLTDFILVVVSIIITKQNSF